MGVSELRFYHDKGEKYLIPYERVTLSCHTRVFETVENYLTRM